MAGSDAERTRDGGGKGERASVFSVLRYESKWTNDRANCAIEPNPREAGSTATSSFLPARNEPSGGDKSCLRGARISGAEEAGVILVLRRSQQEEKPWEISSSIRSLRAWSESGDHEDTCVSKKHFGGTCQTGAQHVQKLQQ